MNADRLLELYDRVAEAPDAIARLRRFVLDLAVRGKLVEQDPDDEPASELLKRIAAEKARLMREKKVRKQRPSAAIQPSETPITIPSSWEWVRLCDLGRLSGGMTPSKNRSEYWGGNIVWLSPKDIKVDEVEESELKITIEGLSETRLELYPEGSLFIVARSGILKRTFPVSINCVPATCNQDLKVLIPYLKSQGRYFQIMFRGLTDFLITELVKTGTTVQSLKYSEFEVQPFPLPPLVEQHRIVAKVEELMALCDRLEEARSTREATRDRLTRASLARLSETEADAATFRSHARFALDALPALTARADQVKQLRQTILNLAVRGKLVAQDPDDEPASELLKRFGKRKRKNRKGRDWLQGANSTDEVVFEAPSGWKWTNIDHIAHRVTVGHVGPMKDKYVEKGIPFLRSQNVRPNVFRSDGLTFIAPEFHQKIIKSALAPGDVVVVRSGNVGTACAIPDALPVANCSDLVVIQRPEAVAPNFLCFYLNSLAAAHVEAGAVGVALTHFNTKSVATMPLPLPPLAEQHRIVAKVDELMALCDRLEACLTDADTTRTRLLEALLHEALEADPEREQAA